MAKKSSIQTNLLGRKVVLNDEWEKTARGMAKYETSPRGWILDMLDTTAEITTVRSEDGELTLTLMTAEGNLIDGIPAKCLKVLR